ncbi:MAG: benzoate/H(+) symporter BenE family transporter [Desulfovibrio sp.]|jgi:hypothetical protein|nr:benzoate/H(+) symporter BenE family transporter [Desulfovibrio sp.]
MALYKREYGAEQPCWPLFGGWFKVRLPFVHYSWSWQDFLQGAVLAATGLAAIPVLQTCGIPYEVCVLMVFISSCCYLVHAQLGDPVVPGWITPGIPLIVAYLGTLPMEARIDHIIATQLTIAVIFFMFGITGIAGKIMNWLPASIKAGILMGAGFAAIMGEFAAKGRFHKYPISITVAVLVAFFILYARGAQRLKKNNKFFAKIATLGIVPSIVVAAIAGFFVQEVAWGPIKWGFSFSIFEFRTLINDWSVWGRGLPDWSIFVKTFSLAVALYIIAYGDLITGYELVKEADEVRQDEKIDINANRVHCLCGIRNTVLGTTSPYAVFHGPIWGGAHVATMERYKLGRQAMDSIFDGAGFFYLGATFVLCLAPFVAILSPMLPVALSLTMIMQGWVCGQVAVAMVKNKTDLGIMTVMGGVIAVMGASYGLITGFVLYFLVSLGSPNPIKKQLEADAGDA